MSQVDYTKFAGLAGAKRKDVTDDGAKRWWELDDGKLRAQAISSNLDFLQRNQGIRLAQLVMSARLYGNLSLLGVNGLTYSKVASVHPSIRERISYNLVQSCIDAITSKMAKNKPKPLFLTSGGDYRLQRRAKKLNQFVEGIFWENEAYRQGPMVFRDACVWGDGVTHVYNGNGRCKWERVLSSELWVDEIEGFYGDPRTMHRAKNIDRDVLIANFPKAKDLLANADRTFAEEKGDRATISDTITVRQSWHLPSKEGASDGRCVVSINEGELDSWKWEHDFFPFARMQWSKRLHGFWGQGLAEQLQNLQLEINKLLWVIQRSMHLAGSFKLFLHNTSKIVKEHINNDLGSMIVWAGQNPPQYVTPPIVPQEIYQHLGTLIQRGFEQSGVSQLSATSQKPDGLNSGKALREFNDIESDRFMTVGQAYESYFLDLSELSVATVKDIAEDTGKKSYSVNVPGKKWLETVDWKDVNLKDSQYVMQCYPVSSLPNTPEGRLATLQEFAQAGLIDQEEVRPLMDFPDLQQSGNLAGAAREVLERNLEKIVEGNGEDDSYVPPEPFDNLQLAYKLASQYYAQGRLQDLEEEKLELLRRYMAQVQRLMQAAMPPPPPGAPPGAMPPQAAPAAPPVSDLLPNAPPGAA